MTDQTTTTLLNAKAFGRQDLKRYLVNLPILHRRVLDCHYAENKCATSIGVEMGLSRLHVERIPARAQAFATSGSGKRPIDRILARSQSQLAA